MHTAIVWTEAEINRFSLRKAMFLRRGMGSDAAERLADACVRRDRDKDDRRACIECKHMQEGGFCKATKNWALPNEIFHRCHAFDWQVPRKN